MIFVLNVVALLAVSSDLPSWKPSFPPKALIDSCSNHSILPLTVPACPAVANWLAANTPPLKVPDPTLTTRQEALARMSVSEYIASRKAGNVTSEEYVVALTKRATYYQYVWHSGCIGTTTRYN
jgi:hypothetical protein